jgi:Zn-dependent peptidase ImmA (M78 family)
VRRAAIDDVEVGRRYLAGDSERRLVAAFGVSRDAIRRRLDEQGIVRRSRAEAGRARYHRLDAAARQAAVAGARAANTGRQHSE